MYVCIRAFWLKGCQLPSLPTGLRAGHQAQAWWPAMGLPPGPGIAAKKTRSSEHVLQHPTAKGLPVKSVDGATSALVPVGIHMPRLGGMIPPAVEREPEPQPRQMYRKRADYEEHGYTKGCAGCGAWCKGWRHTRHTAACRTPLAIRLFRADFEEHGYTKGCKGCAALQRKGWRQSHSAACRTHMETLLAATPSGVFRLRQYDDRINAHVAGLNQFAPRELMMARLREPGAPIYGTKNEKWARIPKKSCRPRMNT
jgi:hypothetical protein